MVFRTKETGIVTIEAFDTRRGRRKLVGSVRIRVAEAEPQAYYGGRTGGKISKAVFQAQGGVLAGIPKRSGHVESIRVLSYQVIVIRNDSNKVAVVSNEGNRFEAPADELVKSLQPGDIVIIASIDAMILERRRRLHPIEFIIE